MEVTLDTGYQATIDATARARSHARVAAAASSAVEAIEAVDVVLDLSRGARDLLGVVYGLPRESLREFLKLSAELLMQGVAGTETLEVRGEPYKSFIPVRMADPRLRNAPLYRGRRVNAAGRFNLSA